MLGHEARRRAVRERERGGETDLWPSACTVLLSETIRCVVAPPPYSIFIRSIALVLG